AATAKPHHQRPPPDPGLASVTHRPLPGPADAAPTSAAARPDLPAGLQSVRLPAAIEQLLPASPYNDSAPPGPSAEKSSWPTVLFTRVNAPIALQGLITPSAACTIR